MNVTRVISLALLVVLAFIILNPTFWLFFGSFWSSAPGQPGHLTISNYVDTLTGQGNLGVLFNTITFAVLSTVIAFAIGVPLAWIVTSTNTPLRNVLENISLLPYFIPGLVFSIGWILLTSPSIGALNLLLAALFHLKQGPLNIYSMAGMSWLGGLWSASVVFLIVAAIMKSWDSRLEEVASVCGASTVRRFVTVTLPTLRPSLLAAGSLVFVRMFEDFLFPATIGLPANIRTYATQIFGYFEDLQYGLATASSVILFAIIGLLFLFYARSLRSQERFRVTGERGFVTRIRDIGRWRYVTFAFVLFYLAVAAVLPLLVVVLASVFPIYSLVNMSLSGLTMRFYIQLMNDSISVSSVVNSTVLATGAATIAILMAGIIGYLGSRSRTVPTRLLSALSVVPLAFPGIVLGMGLLWGYIFVNVGVYGTIWILLIAYVTRFLPYAERNISSSFAQTNLDMDDAAAVCGAGIVSRLRNVMLPIIKPSLAAAWVLVLANSLTELSTSILLYTSNSEVAGVSILQLYDYNAYNELSALSVIITIILVVLSMLALWLGRRGRLPS